MRRFVLAVAALVLMSSVSCRRQQSDEIGGAGDTTSASAAAPAPAAEVPNTTGIQDFTFDQRQDFAQSIRQQLTELDRQATELGSQVKSRGGAVSDRAVATVSRIRRGVGRDLGRVNTASA